MKGSFPAEMMTSQARVLSTSGQPESRRAETWLGFGDKQSPGVPSCSPSHLELGMPWCDCSGGWSRPWAICRWAPRPVAAAEPQAHV